MSVWEDWDFYLLSFLAQPLRYPLCLIPLVFVAGAMVGSLLNVCVLRMPTGRSLWWPGSCCWQCLQPIRGRDNVPILAYLWLRGRCRACGTRYSPKYCLIELLSACAFAILWWLEVGLNVRRVGVPGMPFPVWLEPSALPTIWVYHAVLLSCLLVGSLTALHHRMVPPGLVKFGAAIGIVGGLLAPWPWPLVHQPAGYGYSMSARTAASLVEAIGLQPRPVGLFTSELLAPGRAGLGLLTSLAGAVVGWSVVRACARGVRLASRRTILLSGESELLLLVGTFVGWQNVLLVFGLALGLYGLGRLLLPNKSHASLVPFLAVATISNVLGVGWLSPYLSRFFPGW